MADLLSATQDQDLSGRFEAVRSLTEQLAAPLSAEDQTVQSMPDVSPTKWHRAHTSWFFETFLLVPRSGGYRAFDSGLRVPLQLLLRGGRRPPSATRAGPVVTARGSPTSLATGPMWTRPWTALLRRRRRARRVARRARDPPRAAAPGAAAHGHQARALVQPDHAGLPTLAREATCPRPAPRTWTHHPGGHRTRSATGATGSASTTSSPAIRVYLEPFALGDRAGDLRRVAGVHRRPRLSPPRSVALRRLGHHPGGVLGGPLYWWRADGEWQEFTLGGPTPIDPGRPVCHVSYYEADAFARWAGARLPTEAEWEVAAERRVTPSTCRPVAPTTGHGRPSPRPNFLDRDVLHPLATGPGRRPSLLGDVWQWTSSAYGPYPGFAPAPGAVGEYNGKFMVNQYVLRGGSCVTPPGHVRATYRNFFPPARPLALHRPASRPVGVGAHPPPRRRRRNPRAPTP